MKYSTFLEWIGLRPNPDLALRMAELAVAQAKMHDSIVALDSLVTDVTRDLYAEHLRQRKLMTFIHKDIPPP